MATMNITSTLSVSTSLLLLLRSKASILFMALLIPLSAARAADDQVQKVTIEPDSMVEKTTAKVRFTFEDLKLPANEHMGFLGSTLLFDVGSWYSVGIGAYGALTGNRGGFITTGLTAEARQSLSEHVEVNSGLFVGGGGGRGGYLLTGGGLMLRYHAGIQYTSGLGNIGAGYSFVDFPDGVIHSSQPYLSYEYTFPTTIEPGWIDPPATEYSGYAKEVEQEFGVVLHTYKVRRGVLQDNGVTRQYPRINVMGVEWNRYLDKNLFVHVETAGAMGGKSQGFMQILFGGGYRMAVMDGTWLKVISSVGVAGGGAVATGGGLLLHESVGLQQQLGDRFYTEGDIGYVFAPGQSFKAISYTAKLGYHFFSPNYDEDVSVADLAMFDFSHLRIRVGQQTYTKAAPNWRTRDQNLNVQLLGIQADYFLNDYLFLTGQTMAAYQGKAGAYMSGLLGFGVHAPVFGPLFVEAELGGGAAGGGSMNVNGGLIWQASGTLGVQVNDQFSLLASYGYLSAPRGKMRAKVLTLGLGYNFTLFSR
ncbi:MAG: hypothetical protein R8K50_04720 [Mariprofundus sp.]